MRVLLLLFLAGLAYGQSIDEDKLRQAMETKCNNNAQNKNAFVELKQTFVNFRQCTQSKFTKEPPNPVEDHEGFCNYLRSSGFYGCVEDMTEGVAPCLDDSEKYLPHLLLHGVNSTYDELCGPQGLANSKLIFNKVASKEAFCSGLNGIAWSEWTCLSELNMIKNLENGIINFNKHDFCLDLDKLQSCMKSVVKTLCSNDDDSKIIDLLFAPFVEECNDLAHD